VSSIKHKRVAPVAHEEIKDGGGGGGGGGGGVHGNKR
jgi:hypothetical protein